MDPFLSVFLGPMAAPDPAPGEGAADRLRDELKRQGERIERLALVNQALIELLRNRLGLKDAELIAAIEEAELQRSREASATTCESCGRRYDRRRDRCLYCGHVRAGNRAEKLLRRS